MLSIPNQLEAAYIGQDVTLECHTEAYPTSINYWTTERGDMIVSGNFNCDTITFIHMIMLIRYTKRTKFSVYNSRGERELSVRILKFLFEFELI